MQECIKIVVLALLQDLSTSFYLTSLSTNTSWVSEVLKPLVVEPAVPQHLPERNFFTRAYSFLRRSLISRTPHLCELDNPMKEDPLLVETKSGSGDECSRNIFLVMMT